MSTCLDKSLYSAYVDGELISSVKEEVEKHLKICKECYNVVNSYRLLTNAICSMPPKTIDFETSFDVLYKKRQQVLHSIDYQSKKDTSWLYKSVKIPIPALAAAAIFLFVCTPVIIFTTRQKTNIEHTTVQIKMQPIVPISGLVHRKKAKKKFLNIPNTMGIENKNKKIDVDNADITFAQFVNLYIPPKSAEKNNNLIFKNTSDDDSFFQNEAINLNTKFVNNDR